MCQFFIAYCFWVASSILLLSLIPIAVCSTLRKCLSFFPCLLYFDFAFVSFFFIFFSFICLVCMEGRCSGLASLYDECVRDGRTIQLVGTQTRRLQHGVRSDDFYFCVCSRLSVVISSILTLFCLASVPPF